MVNFIKSIYIFKSIYCGMVRIFNPQAQSNSNNNIPSSYASHKNEKNTEYGPPDGLQEAAPSTTPAKIQTLDLDIQLVIATPC